MVPFISALSGTGWGVRGRRMGIREASLVIVIVMLCQLLRPSLGSLPVHTRRSEWAEGNCSACCDKECQTNKGRDNCLRGYAERTCNPKGCACTAEDKKEGCTDASEKECMARELESGCTWGSPPEADKNAGAACLASGAHTAEIQMASQSTFGFPK